MSAESMNGSTASGALEADYLARLAEVLMDTRTLAQRMLGDPIPLDKRRDRG